MPETKENGISGLIWLAIVIVIGAVFVQQIANTTHPLTNEAGNGIINESLNITNGTATGTMTSFAHTRIIQGTLVIINATSNTRVDLANFTVGYAGGTITFITDNTLTKSTTFSNRSMTNISYNYHQEEYINDSASRSAISLILLFFTIGIVVYVIGYVRDKYLES